ncbi:MAG: hypothetical protein K2X81_27055 [Candidatus Obscuribacterales bacterium]|nr:hypothetical protein [Candidatus Obscuribacterales bacterium]
MQRSAATGNIYKTAAVLLMVHAPNNQSEGDHRSEKSESKAERVEKKAENLARGEAGHDLGTIATKVKETRLKQYESGNSGASGIGDQNGKFRSAKDILGDAVHKPLSKDAEAKRDTEFKSKHGDPNELQGKKTEPQEAPGQKLEETSVQKTEQRAGAETAAGQLFKSGSLYADGIPRSPNEVIAQIRPEPHAVHEAVETAKGVGLGVLHFTENTVNGVVDTVRMLNAANREAHPILAMLPDSDPVGTEKLHETCQGMAMGSRVLLQYSTTLNEKSPFYRKDFDPEARQAAEKLAQAMPEKLKDEINQYRNADTQTRAAKSTELALDIYACAETGGLAIAKAGQIAKESKILSQISTDMSTFASKLKELPHSDKVTQMTQYLDANLPKFGPKMATEGPSLEPTNGSPENQILRMGKHSDGGKPHRGGDAREAKEAGESRKLNEALELKKIMAEGWDTKDEARAVKYLRDKGEIITKNKLEGKEGWGRQTDGLEWELKNMSNVKERSGIVDAIVDHAKNGSGKNTGAAHIGRVLIDARDQANMTEKLAEKGMKQALYECPLLKEIRIVGKDLNTGKIFDIRKRRGE